MSPARNVDHPSRKIDSNLCRAVESLQLLKEMNISFHLAVHMGGKTQTFGTESCKNVFETHKEEFEGALIADVLELCNAAVDTPSDPNSAASAQEIAENLRHGQGLDEPEYPLILMNRKDKVRYIRILISYDKRKRLGKAGPRIIPGDESWKARFWPEEIVKWSELKVSIDKIKSEHINGDSPNNFYTKVIQAAFDMYGKDRDSFYMKTTTVLKLEARKKLFGIYEAPTIEQSEDEENGNCSFGSDQTYTVFRENDVPAVTNDDDDHYEFPATVNDELATAEEPVHRPDVHEEPVHRPHLDMEEDSEVPVYCELPNQIREIAPAKKIRCNPGKGLCLAYAIAQQGNLDPKELKAYANEKLVEWWVHLKEFITFPLHITIGSGNQSYQKKIDHQYEFFTFLRSSESLYAYNTGEAEIVVLATVINQPIHLVVYNLQGFPPGTPMIERCRIQTVSPKAFLMKNNKFVLKDDVFLLYEDNVHFSLLVDRSEGVVPAPASDVFNDEDISNTTEAPTNIGARSEWINDLHFSLFPGEESEADDLNTTLPTAVTEENDCSDTSSRNSKRKASESAEGSRKRKNSPIEASNENLQCSLRRSKRIQQKKNTLDKILEIPGTSVQQREKQQQKEINEFEKRRIEREKNHEKDMDKVKRRMEEFKRQEHLHNIETVELSILADTLRRELTEERIKEIFVAETEYFENVKAGLVDNWRHALFVSPGNSDPQLRKHLVGPPFNDVQEEIVYGLTKQIWLKDRQMYMDNNFYVSHVLFPTILIRIYQVFFEIESFEEAERRIRNNLANLEPSPNNSASGEFLA